MAATLWFTAGDLFEHGCARSGRRNWQLLILHCPAIIDKYFPDFRHADPTALADLDEEAYLRESFFWPTWIVRR
jgi:hypothetical protein